MIMDDPRTQLVGGDLWALPQPVDPEYGAYILSPRQVRTLIAERRWERALAFQTRNPLHRAHEYALVAGVEQLTRAGLLRRRRAQPAGRRAQGRRRPGPRAHALLPRAARPASCSARATRTRRCGSERGYDLTEVFELVGLDIKMLYGGPKEAVMHGIYRQNLGFTDIVIGRKHADAPFDDGKAIWGDFDAQEIFDNLQRRPAHPPLQHRLRRVLRQRRPRRPDGQPPGREAGRSSPARRCARRSTNGERPDPRILRPEIADILIDYYRSKEA